MPLKQLEKNNSSLLQIVFDGERMKYPNTGLFAFCKFLGAALLQRKEIATTIYQDINASSVWMNRPKILEKKFWHKWWMPNLNQYHLWHATYQGTNYFPFSFKGKILLTIHDINFMHENKSDKKKEKYLAKLQKKIDRADALSFISKYVYDDVSSHLDIAGKKYQVIYNGCNSLQEVIAIQPKFIQDEVPFLFSIGTIHEKKNFDVLLPMMQHNNYKLIIAGTIVQPSYYEHLTTQIQNLGLQDRVMLSGPISEGEKKWLYTHTRAFLFPSKAEGFGMPVIEAMECGACCVLSTFTCLPEIGKSYAAYFNNFDPAGMANVVETTIQQWTHSKKAEAKKHAASFQWNEVAAEYTQLYQELLAS